MVLSGKFLFLGILYIQGISRLTFPEILAFFIKVEYNFLGLVPVGSELPEMEVKNLRPLRACHPKLNPKRPRTHTTNCHEKSNRVNVFSHFSTSGRI